MPLQCKNCGGNIYLDDQTQKLTCDSCGVSQNLNALSAEMIFEETDAPIAQINAYRRAIALLSSADTEKSLLMVADLLSSVGDLFNAPQLANECRERAELLKKDRYYQQALDWMQRDEPDQIQKAIEIFEDLQGYKESNLKIIEAKRLLEEASIHYERRKKQEEAVRKKAAARKRRNQKRLLLLASLILIAVLGGNWALHRPGNIKISISPNQDNYVTTKFNDYVFHYDITIKNKSPLDLTAIEAEVYLEEPDGTILIDADFNVGSIISQSKPVVRGKKSSDYTWSVTVPSKNTAETLYQYDFDDLKVKIKIKTLRYGEEKVRHY